MDYSLPGCSVQEILWARIMDWLPFSSPGDLPDPGIELKFTMAPALLGGFFTSAPPVILSLMS